MVPFTSLFINGQEVTSTETFDVRNPFSNEIVGTAAQASSQDCKNAVQAAGLAFVKWDSLNLAAKRDIFLKASDLLLTEKYKTKVTKAMEEETAAESGWSVYHWFLTAQLLRSLATGTNGLNGDSFSSLADGGQVIVQRKAIGVILTVAPWNAPLYLTIRSIAIAIICGNTVVLKCSETSPRSQTIAAELFQEAGLPNGVLNTVITTRDRSPSVMAELIAHPLVQKISFTGSSTVGKAVAAEAAKHLKPCILELDGHAAAIVLNDADVNQAAKAIVFGALGHSGQVCLSTERIIVQKEISQSLLSLVSDLCRSITAGNTATDPNVKIPPLINVSAAERVLSRLQEAKKDGADILVGDLKSDGPVIQPHLIVGAKPGMKIWDDEIFGPVIAVAIADTIDDAIELANSTHHTLTASLWTKSVQTAMDAGLRIRASLININGATMHAETRVSATGLGGPSGYGGFDIDDFTEKRAIVFHPSNQFYPLVG